MLTLQVIILVSMVILGIFVRRITMNIQDILAKVTAQKTVIDSAAALLASLSQEIKDAGTDPAALQAISDALDANGAELTAAITANTPAAPTTDTPPVQQA